MDEFISKDLEKLQSQTQNNFFDARRKSKQPEGFWNEELMAIKIDHSIDLSEYTLPPVERSTERRKKDR